MDMSPPGDESNLQYIINWGKLYEYSDKYDENDENCLIIDNKTQEFLNMLVIFISIIGIVLLIIMSAADFAKAITSSDEDGIKKAFKHTIIRIICVVFLLLLPTIITFIINIVNDNAPVYKIGKDGNPLCGVAEK